jgi:hypothetical protein
MLKTSTVANRGETNGDDKMACCMECMEDADATGAMKVKKAD